MCGQGPRRFANLYAWDFATLSGTDVDNDVPFVSHGTCMNKPYHPLEKDPYSHEGKRHFYSIEIHSFSNVDFGWQIRCPVPRTIWLFWWSRGLFWWNIGLFGWNVLQEMSLLWNGTDY